MNEQEKSLPDSLTHHLTVSQDESLAVYDTLLVRKLTMAHDALFARRRRAPSTKIEEIYVLGEIAGDVRLTDMFDGRRQLVANCDTPKSQDISSCAVC